MTQFPDQIDNPADHNPASHAGSATKAMKAQAYPGFLQAIALIVSLVILQVLLTIPFLLVGLYPHPAALGIPTLIGTAVVVVFGYSLNFNRTGAKFREVFPFGAVSVRILLALLLAVIGFVILNLALARFMVRLIPPPKFFSQFIAQTLRGQQPLAVFFTIAVILPIGEEFLFRGLILHAFLSRYRTRMAIISSAILFGLMHGNPWQFVTGVSMGIFFAWCLVRSQSLVPCLYAHFANNAIVLMLPGLQPKMPDIAKWIITHPVWIGAAGLFLAISGIYLLRELFDKMAAERKNIPAMNEAGISGNQETPADLKEN